MIRSTFTRGVAVMVALTLSPLPALADPASGASEAESSEKASDPNRMVCKRVEAIGSRLQTKRECKTAKQWADELASDRRDLDRMQTGRYKSN